MARLRIKSVTEDEPTYVELTDRLTIGRNRHGGVNDVDAHDYLPPRPANFISKNHAEIKRVGDRYIVRDRGSLEGTSVNGGMIEPNVPVRLNDGDKIGIPGTSDLIVMTYEQ